MIQFAPLRRDAKVLQVTNQTGTEDEGLFAFGVLTD